MKVIKLLFVVVFGVAVGACGGGGGGGGNTGGTSGTAAQYFTKKAVGNTWSILQECSYTETGWGTSVCAPTTMVVTVTASTGGVITNSITKGSNPSYFRTMQINADGAWETADGTGWTGIVLPATFSVGTTWVMNPADPAAGDSAENATITAFNVTRTVPAGTFTDCLQIDSTWSNTDSVTGKITAENVTYYISPTVGYYIERNSTASGSISGVVTSTSTGTSQLQAGYVANP